MNNYEEDWVIKLVIGLTLIMTFIILLIIFIG